MLLLIQFYPYFFFTDSATSEIYTLSLHDALPISFIRTNGKSESKPPICLENVVARRPRFVLLNQHARRNARSEEHTSELQSHSDLVCRLLLEKKKSSPALSWLEGCNLCLLTYVEV